MLLERLGRRGVRAPRHGVGDELLGRGPLPPRTGALAPGHDHRLGHSRVAGQGGLDLAQLDPVTPDLDLEVLAPQELDGAARQVAAQVAGAVQALAGLRAGDEALRGLRPLTPVAQRHARAADGQLPGHPVGTGLEAGAQDVEALAGERAAVGDAPPARLDPADGVEDRPDRALGGAAQAHDLGRLAGDGEAPDALRQGEGDPVPREEDGPQRRGEPSPGRLRVLHEHLHQGRYRVPEGDPAGPGERRPVRRLPEARGAGQDHRPAGAQDAEEVVDRKVEAQRGDPEDPVLGPHGEAPVDVGHRVDGAPVVDHHPLGAARGARGVDDVGEIGGLARARRLGGRAGPGRRPVQRDGPHPLRPLELPGRGPAG